MTQPVSILPFPIPFCPILYHPRVDDLISFAVAALMAITAHAEAQAFMATLLGDAQEKNPKRFHFNAFLHLDIAGTLCFIAAGFGWPRHVQIQSERFSRPRLYTVLSYLAGPVSNLFLASIAGSVVWLYQHFGVEDRVFRMVATVNLTVAVYHLLPIPPLAASSIWPALFPSLMKRWASRTWQTVGAAVLILYFGFEQITAHPFISDKLTEMIMALYHVIIP